MVSSNSKRGVRRAVVAGALALGAVTLSAGPALADTIEIPGVGSFELPPGVSVPPEVSNLIPQGGAAPAVPGAPAIGSVGDRAAAAAQTKLGSPYVYGAAGPDSFDCSGLVQWAYRQAGLNLPRTSYDQVAAGTSVSTAALAPGDVVSYYGGSHSGIYIGNGNIVHASTAGQPVKIAPVDSMPMDGARRF